jgi:uncharacterized membrane protein YebE (DUF533 family)
MSAEPADRTPPALTGLGEAAVIDFSTRARASRRPEKGRRKHVTSPPPSTPGGTPQQQLAEHIETTFNHHRLSLTDEMAKATFTVTLEIVRGLIEGAQAQGIVDSEQRAELDIMIKGVAAAPRLIV